MLLQPLQVMDGQFQLEHNILKLENVPVDALQ